MHRPALLLNKGFTLLELLIVIVIIGILAVGGVKIYSTFYQLDKANQAQVDLIEIREALMTFLKVNLYLPCPDTNGNGRENRSTNGGVERCTADNGYLPSEDIGMPEFDPWGNRFLYKVNARADDATRIVDICQTASVFGRSGARTYPTADFAQCSDTGIYYCNDDCASASNVCGTGNCVYNKDPRLADEPPYFGMMTPPVSAQTDGYKNLTIYDSASLTNVVDDLAVAVVVSFGENGAKTWANCNDANSAAEKENCTVAGDERDFVQATQSSDFDDYLTWIRLNDAKQAMFEVGAYEYD